jgi:hypothetical protein
MAWLKAPNYQGPSQLMGLPVLVQPDSQTETLKKQGGTDFLFGIGSVKATLPTGLFLGSGLLRIGAIDGDSFPCVSSLGGDSGSGRFYWRKIALA